MREQRRPLPGVEVPCRGTAVEAEFRFDDERPLAIASFNDHELFFGEAFGITLAGGAPAWSGCVAFGLERWLLGILAKYGTQLIGAQLDAIEKAEDRQRFKDCMTAIGIDVPKSGVAHSVDEIMRIGQELGFPLILRPSFTLGGLGGGIAYNREELDEMGARALSYSPTHEVHPPHHPHHQPAASSLKCPHVVGGFSRPLGGEYACR